MATIVHSTLVNTTSDREIHTPGYSPMTYTTLLTVSGMEAGDVAPVTMNGNTTYWFYDGQISAWRIMGNFSTTEAGIAGNTKLAGMLPGDWAFCTDSGRMGYWNGTAYNFLS